MADNVYELPSQVYVNEDIVKYLESLLAMAKAGEMQCFAAAYVNKNGGTDHLFSVSPGTRPLLLVGEATTMAMRITIRYGMAEKT